jgi:hypothetical protein
VIDLDRALAQALAAHQEAVERLCEIPGISVFAKRSRAAHR